MENRPNILIFMTDQQRADTVYPVSRAITPNLDKIASQGLAFSNAFTVSPHCCPSRASFFTGLYPTEHGVWNNVSVGNTLSKGLYDNTTLFSEYLKEVGYENSFFGKWHVSSLETPLDRGFDKLGISTCVPEKTGKYKHTQPSDYEWSAYEAMNHNKTHIDGEIHREGYPQYIHYGTSDNPFGDNDVIKDAIDTIVERAKSNQGKEASPWLQYIGPLGPHDPYLVPQKYLDMYRINDIELSESFVDEMKDKPGLYRKTRDVFAKLSEREQKEAIRHYLAFCTYEDELFGRVISALEDTNELENTLVIYLSDHGDYCTDHQLWCKGLPCFRGAYHIPMIMHWPNGIVNKGRIINDFVSILDIAPTILEITGVKTVGELSGHSLLNYLRDLPIEEEQKYLFTQTNGNELYGIQRSIQSKEWKFVYNGFDYDELYHLKSDPNEMKNLIDEYRDSDVLKVLSRELWKFAKQHQDVCINPYIMVGLAPYGPGIIQE